MGQELSKSLELEVVLCTACNGVFRYKYSVTG